MRMPSVGSELEWVVRLSGQLESLSRLTESLTYRILELEERLAAQDRHIRSIQEAADALITRDSEIIVARIEGTEDRLASIEALLHGEPQRQASSRSLRALSKPPVQAWTSSVDQDLTIDEDPLHHSFAG